MEILSSVSLFKPADKPRKRKRQVRFDVPDESEDKLDKVSRKRRKSPSPSREEKKNKVCLKRPRFHRGISKVNKTSKRGVVLRKITTRKLARQQPMVRLRTDSEEPTTEQSSDTLSSVAIDKNENCSVTDREKGTNYLTVTKKQTGQSKALSKAKNKNMNKTVVRVKAKRSGLKGNRKRLIKVNDSRKTQVHPHKQQKHAKEKLKTRSQKSKDATFVRRCYSKRKDNRPHKTQRKTLSPKRRSRTSKTKKRKLSKAIQRKLHQQKKKAEQKKFAMRLKQEQKSREEKRQLLWEIQMERLDYERRYRRKLRIIPIERNENYDVIPALRISFLKYITFKEAFEHNTDCCNECCWDRWSEVDAEDIEDDYN